MPKGGLKNTDGRWHKNDNDKHVDGDAEHFNDGDSDYDCEDKVVDKGVEEKCLYTQLKNISE